MTPWGATGLRIFHYQPWYTYVHQWRNARLVENLSLSALIYLSPAWTKRASCWESFIISLDILTRASHSWKFTLRIFHYQPWYTYPYRVSVFPRVENLSLSALIYLPTPDSAATQCWESFIISLDILKPSDSSSPHGLRIFHYQPWYTYLERRIGDLEVENLSLSALIYLAIIAAGYVTSWESFIISLDILTSKCFKS